MARQDDLEEKREASGWGCGWLLENIRFHLCLFSLLTIRSVRNQQHCITWELVRDEESQVPPRPSKIPGDSNAHLFVQAFPKRERLSLKAIMWPVPTGSLWLDGGPHGTHCAKKETEKDEKQVLMKIFNSSQTPDI